MRALVWASLLLAAGVHSAQLSVEIQSGIQQDLPDLSGAVLYLDSPEAQQTHIEESAPSAQMAQENLQFAPFIRVVRQGEKVAFPNRDDVAHHVYSFSKNNAFELELYKGRDIPQKRFKSGQISLGCNIHDWMQAYIYVVDTPWYTQSQGPSAHFDKVPPGRYTLRFWHPGMDRKENIEQVVELSENTNRVIVHLQYELKAVRQADAPEEQFDDASDY